MTIGPLSEFSQMFNQVGPAQSSNPPKGDDFSTLIDKVSATSKDPYMENLPVASNNIKDTNRSDDLKTNSRDEFEKKISDSKSEDNKNSDSLSTGRKDSTLDGTKDKATGKLKDEIVNEAAKKLGISEEELENLLSQLGLTAADLCNTENVSMVVAKLMGEGDMLSLVTDESVSDMVLQLNSMIEDMIGQVAEEFDIAADMLKDWMSQLSGEEDVANIDTLSINNGLASQDMAGVDNTLSEVSSGNTKNDNSGAGAENKFENKFNDDQLASNMSLDKLNDNFNPDNMVVEENISYTDVDAESIISQIRDQVRVQINDQVTSLSMQLNPENLGTVNLTVASKEGNVTAYISTTNEAVQSVIEAQLAQLKESLEQQGIKVEAIEVAVGAHEFEQNLEQGNDRNDAQEQLGEELKKATRKLNINGFLTDEDIESLDEDEIVTAKMMRADGNSMDYKV